MFDPNQPLPDFQTQSAEIQRQRLIAEMLRKQSAGQPQGKMVGKQYIAPNLLEYLPGLLNQYDAGQMSRKADTAEKQYGSDVSAAKENWTSSLPRAVAAVPGRVALPGPPDANGSPELAAVAPVPARLPDRESVLKATLAGMRIPGNEKAAELWNKGMGDDLTREDNQQARRENMEATRAADADRRRLEMEQRQREAELRSQDARLSIEQRAQAAKEANETKLALGQMIREAAASKVEKPKELKNLPAAQSKAWIENSSGIASVENALKIAGDNPKAFGLKNYLPDAVMQRVDPKGVEARAAVANLGSLRIHDRSGAAVTASETPRLMPFIPNARDDYETIEKKLKGFKREYEIIQREILEFADTQGYKPPGTMKVDQPPAPPAGGPPRVRGQADVDKLTPGTTFIGEDGKTYRKQ